MHETIDERHDTGGVGNTSCHSANGRFDVTMVLLFWYLRLISSNSRSAWRLEYER